MAEKTKQHYVWECYLKGWATDGQIWARREGKVFRTSTENVAQQRDFYELEPLSNAEIALVGRLIDSGPAINRAVNLSSLQTYVNLANGPVARTGLESYYEDIEGNATEIIQGLREGRAELLLDRQEKIHLCICLGHQYVRTKKMRAQMVNVFEGMRLPARYDCLSLDRALAAFAFILASSIGSCLFDVLELRLLKNQTATRLVTSDQPIYNILAVDGETPKGTSIYVPLSPDYALWATDVPSDGIIDTDERVAMLNAFVAANSLEFVFASAADDLQVFT